MDRDTPNQVRLAVKILPNAARNSVLGLVNDVWRIKIAAPPERGKANKELIEFLSQRLGVKKDNLAIIKGHTNQNKLIAVRGPGPDEIFQKMMPE